MIRLLDMITLTRQDGKPLPINPNWIGLVDPDGFGNGCWITYGNGTTRNSGRVHVKESVAEVKAKMKVKA